MNEWIPRLLLVSLLSLGASACVHTTHDVAMEHKIDPIRVEPIEVNVNVNVRVQVQRDLDQVFEEIDEASTTVIDETSTTVIDKASTTVVD